MNEKEANSDNEQRDFEYKNYCKYFSDSKDIIDSLFKCQKIRFTQPWALNDPLEFNPRIIFNTEDNHYDRFLLNGIELPSLEEFYRINLIESQMNEYGILSLTKVPDCFEMWNRYANGHKGFMLEFKSEFNKHICMKPENSEVYPMKEVVYVDNYDINLDELANEKDTIEKKDVRETLFFNKTSRWNYEKEYRIVRPLTDCSYYEPPKKNTQYRDNKVYLFDFSLECIESVVFGAHMSVENKKLIERCCKDYGISYLQAVIYKDERDRFGQMGKIKLEPVDNFQSRDDFYRIRPEVFSLDKNYFIRKKIHIKSLEELLYYENHEEYCNDMFRRLSKNSEE